MTEPQQIRQLLQDAGWVATDALFQRSSFADKSEFNAELARLERKNELQLRGSRFGREAALPGVAVPDEISRDARSPERPAGSGPVPELCAPQPLLEAPTHVKRAPDEEQPAITAPAPETPSIPHAAPAEEPTMGKKNASPGKHGEKREQILGLLRQSPWTSAELAKACDVSPAGVLYHLKQLREERLVKMVGAGSASKWQIAGDGNPGAIAAVDQVRKNGRKHPSAQGRVSTVSEALQQLEQRLQRRIERLDMKLQVLDRLAAIVDPTIAAVLGEIRADLAP